MNRNILGLLVPCSIVALTTLVGCKKDEPPPPLPAPQVVTAAPAPLQLKPEDAGLPTPPASAEPTKTGKGSGSGGSLGPCCAALAQNAASMPDPTQKMYMTMAAQACKSFLAQGMGKSAVGQLSAMMRGAGLPPACH